MTTKLYIEHWTTLLMSKCFEDENDVSQTLKVKICQIPISTH